MNHHQQPLEMPAHTRWQLQEESQHSQHQHVLQDSGSRPLRWCKPSGLMQRLHQQLEGP